MTMYVYVAFLVGFVVGWILKSVLAKLFGD